MTCRFCFVGEIITTLCFIAHLTDRIDKLRKAAIRARRDQLAKIFGF